MEAQRIWKLGFVFAFIVTYRLMFKVYGGIKITFFFLKYSIFVFRNIYKFKFDIIVANFLIYVEGLIKSH